MPKLLISDALAASDCQHPRMMITVRVAYCVALLITAGVDSRDMQRDERLDQLVHRLELSQ